MINIEINISNCILLCLNYFHNVGTNIHILYIYIYMYYEFFLTDIGLIQDFIFTLINVIVRINVEIFNILN